MKEEGMQELIDCFKKYKYFDIYYLFEHLT